MTIRKQWMLALVVSAALSVIVNSLVLNVRINRYFVDYSAENYNTHVLQVVQFSTDALSAEEYTTQQLEMQLTSHLSDPITRIRLYRADGELLSDVSVSRTMMGMMRSGTTARMMGSSAEEIDSLDIQKDGVLLGKLLITRYSSIGSSIATRQFAFSLITNSLLSFGIVFALTLILGYFLSKRMSKDLILTAKQAVTIDLGQEIRYPKSRVLEISTIQDSLETLQTQLKLKQTSRKKRIDELVHQTRTPLTILRTHLEGFQDGIIRFTPEEVKTCETQIDNLSSIITNMSGLIDAEKDVGELHMTNVDLSMLVRQIVAGLKAQFDQKSVELAALNHNRMMVHTDPYLLSQAIYNLLTNAYKFTPSGGRVTIAYEVIDQALVISVRDTGVGIPTEEQTRVFEAYYRGKNAVHTSGEGIGLYLVKENLQQIGGRIELESAPGKGSTFKIFIPVNG
jgi:signal transduction histidine kinase